MSGVNPKPVVTPMASLMTLRRDQPATAATSQDVSRSRGQPGGVSTQPAAPMTSPVPPRRDQSATAATSPDVARSRGQDGSVSTQPATPMTSLRRDGLAATASSSLELSRSRGQDGGVSTQPVQSDGLTGRSQKRPVSNGRDRLKCVPQSRPGWWRKYPACHSDELSEKRRVGSNGVIEPRDFPQPRPGWYCEHHASLSDCRPTGRSQRPAGRGCDEVRSAPHGRRPRPLKSPTPRKMGPPHLGVPP